MDGRMDADADGQNRQNGRCVGCCGRRALKAKVIRTLLSLPFHRREERGGMEWHCCKWPLPLLFCYNNDNFIAFQPLSLSLPKEAKCSVRPSELSLFISLSAELGMLFLPAKIPLRFSRPCLMRPFAMSHYGGETRGNCRTLTSCDLVITRPSIKPTVGPRI